MVARPSRTETMDRRPSSRDRVLIVDDESQILNAITDLLEDDYDVITARSAEAALRELGKYEIAVILSDQRMPGMSGDTFLKNARSLSRATRVLVTGYADLTALVRAVNDGQIYAYVAKPWEPTELIVMVQRAAEHYHLLLDLEKEQELLRALMDNVPDPIYFKDGELRFAALNSPAAQILGIGNQDNVLGRREMDLLKAEIAQIVYQDEQRILQKKTPLIDKVEQFTQPNGEVRWLSTTKVPVVDRNGEVRGLVSISRDFTDRKRTEDRLHQKERMLANLLANVPGMVYRCRNDRDRTIELVSDGCLALTGYPSDDFIGNRKLSYAQLIHPDDRERVWNEIQSALKDRRTFTLEYRIVAADGTTKWIWERGVGTCDVDNQIEALEGVIQDVSEHKRAQRALDLHARYQAAYAELEQWALVDSDINEFLDRACFVVVRTLGAEYAMVAELRPDGRSFLLRAGSGLRSEHVGSAIVEGGRESHAGYTLLAHKAVASQNLRGEARFRASPLLQQYGIVSGTSAVISGPNQPYGVLAAYGTAPREYGEDEIEFVKSVAGIAAQLIDRRRTDQALRANEERFRSLVIATSQIIWSTDANGRVGGPLPSWQAYTGQTTEEILGDGWSRALHPEDIERVIGVWDRAISDKSVYEVEYRIRRDDGVFRDFAVRGVPILDRDNNIREWVGTCIDITEKKHANQQLQLWASALGNIAEGVLIADAQDRIVAVNRAFTALTDYTADEVIDRAPALLRADAENSQLAVDVHKELRRAGYWRGEILARRKNGETYPAWMSVGAVKNSSDETTHFVYVFNDISLNKQYEERLRVLAHHDTLTALPNRSLLMELLQQAVSRARRYRHPIALLFVDLDNFKTINDSLGHAAGDYLLRSAAERLGSCLRDSDTVARYGGDEFVVILNALRDSRDAAVVAEKLLQSLGPAFQYEDNEFYVSASIGISCFPDDANDADVLLKNADTAMYQAKERGRNNYRFYSPEMNAQAFENLMLTTQLRTALKHDQLILDYQPCVNLETSALTSVEALVRWRHPERGLVPPDQFIPLAEQSGLIDRIDDWVLRTACSQTATWHKRGVDNLRVAVNLSAREFQHPDLPERVAAALVDTGLEARWLTLEITESIMMKDPDSAGRMLQALHEMGVSVAVDDFGTGYSSLSYLKRFPLDYLKIDRSFVRDIPQNADDVAITRSIIWLAKALKLHVIAEGVETQKQAEFLRAEGCDEAQGFFFARPEDADKVTKILGTKMQGGNP